MKTRNIFLGIGGVIAILFIINYMSSCMNPACSAKNRTHCNTRKDGGNTYSNCVVCGSASLFGCPLETNNSCVGKSCHISA